MNKNDIKVLLIGTVPPPVGGDATWALEYLKYCELQGYKTHLVDTSLIGRRAVTTDDSCNISDEIKRCIRIWKDLSRGIKQFKPDIVHLNSNCSGRGIFRDYVCGLIIQLHKIPFVVHCHCNISTQLGGRKSSIACFAKLVRKAKRVLVLNSSSKDFVSQFVGNRACIIPNYIDSSLPVKHKNIKEHIEQVLFVGHIKKTKGVMEILEVAKTNPDIKFVLAGPLTDDFNQEEILLKAAGNLELTGSVSGEEIKEYLDRSDVFLFPSYTEGFSLALLEAMARGLPIISTDVGANKDMIETEGGILVGIQNSKEIEIALSKMRDQNIRATMSRWNIDKVNQCYTIDNVIENIREIYLEVVNENFV